MMVLTWPHKIRFLRHSEISATLSVEISNGKKIAQSHAEISHSDAEIPSFGKSIRSNGLDKVLFRKKD